MPGRDDVAVWIDASKFRSLKKDEFYGQREVGESYGSRGGHLTRRYRRLWCVEEICGGEPLFAEIHGYSFSVAGQVQDCAMSLSKPKFSTRNIPRSFTNCNNLVCRIFSNNLPTLSKKLMGR